MSQTYRETQRTGVVFFGGTFVVSWAVWIPAGGWGWPLPVVVMGAAAPTVMAVFLAAWEGGRPAIRALLGTVLRYRVHPGLYVLASAGPLVVAVGAVVGATLAGGPAPSLTDLPARLGLPPSQAGRAIGLLPFVFAGSFLGGPLLEEVGWRGYAQPRLERWLGVGGAGAVIGAVWSVWHLPLLVFFPSITAGIPLVYYLPLVTAFGICFAWMYAMSGGSVLLTIVLHAGVNFAFGAYGPLDVTASPERLGALVVTTWLVALAALVHLRRRAPARE